MTEEEIKPLLNKLTPILMNLLSSSDMEAFAELVFQQLTKQGIGLDIELSIHFGGRLKANVRPVTDFEVIANQEYTFGEAGRFTMSLQPKQKSPKTKVFTKNFG